MKPIAFAIMALALVASACQPKLLPFKEKGKYGFKDPSGNVKIQPQFQKARDFSCGWARVGVIHPKIDSIWMEGYFEEAGYYRIDTFDETFFTFVDANGKVQDQYFEKLGEYHQCLARAEVDGQWGYLNKNGNWLVEPQFADAEDFKNGKAVVRLANDSFWFDAQINSKGKIISKSENGYPIPTPFDSISEWRVMLASSKDYVRLADESTAMDYLGALTRRLDEIRQEDTLATMEILCRYAHLSAENYMMYRYYEFQPKAATLYEEVIKTDIERKRFIILEYIDHLNIMVEVFRARDQEKHELAMLKKVMDAVKRSGTEDPALYWDVAERIAELEAR